MTISKKPNGSKKNILITGGAGFIGGTLIRNLILNSEHKIFNLDKLGYASDELMINKCIIENKINEKERYKLLKIDLKDIKDVRDVFGFVKPDIVLHLAAESHVDNSIKDPTPFIESNILGTFNLLEASRSYFDKLKGDDKNLFRFLHISTDEVFGSLGKEGFFTEKTKYDPRSPYSASKASSDHLVNAWHHTYGLPILVTNCSNNYGPCQYPEKLIPLIIINAINNKKIPIYGNGNNIRDWLYVEDHVEAIIKVVNKGVVGGKYCIGGQEEKTNNEIVNTICEYLDLIKTKNTSYKELIKYVDDRKGHDFRYSINTQKITKELNWKPKFSFNEAIKFTVNWYLENLEWIGQIKRNSY